MQRLIGVRMMMHVACLGCLSVSPPSMRAGSVASLLVHLAIAAGWGAL